ncbi:MAG: ribonuclease T [Gammaproteobacteria bacterium]|nr:MAG: ribonuclease T [Gammaproteobacteria bacterium]
MYDAEHPKSGLSQRFRGFLPVVVDVETAGFNSETDALLEIAAVLLGLDEEGRLCVDETVFCNVLPFKGANLDPKSLEFTGIDPYHPFRFAVEEREALDRIFQPVRQAVRHHGCTRAILVGHNAFFDLQFLNAAVNRTGIKKNPFHAFSSFDTVSLAGLVYGQTVLSRSVQAAGLDWDETQAHSALYDAERTAQLFCKIVNSWDEKSADRLKYI